MSVDETVPLVLVTPPPTPNGRLHIGHVAGPYLRADLLARLARRSGREVHHVSHLDTYQSYVPKKAAQLGMETFDFLHDTGNGIKSDFLSFGVTHDVFIDNESREYLEFLDSALLTLLPLLPVSERPAMTCDECGTHLFESNVKGYCRFCFHDCFQNVCENCCQPQEYSTMVRPTCEACGSVRASPSADDRDLVIPFAESDIARVRSIVAQCDGGNRRLRSLFELLQPHGLSLTYTANYGIFPAPLNGAGSLNPWVEIYFGHLFATFRACGITISKGFPDAADALRALPKQPEIVAFFGVDNAYYYSFVFPYLSLLLELPQLIPTQLKASFFLQLNDAKISSSRNNVIWAAELLPGENVDRLRTNLAVSCPEYASRNYAETGPRRPELTGITELADGEAPGEAVRVLDARVSSLATPRLFDVETLLNSIDKGRGYAVELRKRGSIADADHLDRYLYDLTVELAIG